MEGLTNADAHPTHMQKLLTLAGVADTRGYFSFPTGVSAGLQGNSQLSVVLEILSIGHAIEAVDISGDSDLAERNDYYVQVRTEPRAATVSAQSEDFIYNQYAVRQWGREGVLAPLNAYHTHGMSNTEHYAQNGFGILIAAPELRFNFRVTGGDEGNRDATVSFHMLYRYRTVPFHMFKKLHSEQTTRGARLVPYP